MKKVNSNNKLYQCIVLVITLFGSQILYAGEEPEIKGYLEKDQISQDSSLVIFDNQSFDSLGVLSGSYNSIGYVEYKVQNRVYLELNEYLDSCFIDTFTARVTLELTYKDVNGTQYMDTIELEVNYDTSLLNKNKEIASYLFSGGLWSKLRILSVSNSQYRNYLKVGQTLLIERYRDLASTNIVFNTIQFIDSTSEAKFTWNTIEGAEKYEFEWTWVDAIDYNGNLKAAGNVNDISFRHNNSSVTISDVTYSISSGYERGYLVARVRAIGNVKYKPEQVINGVWSNDAYSENLVDYVLNKDYAPAKETGNSAVEFVALNDSMNWQYVATYAEEGKRKEVVSYYDGSLRNRQSVTRISSGMHAIVGETVYDYEGRPAVNILPVPAYDNQLSFHPAFNRSDVTAKTYNKSDFDNEGANVCQSYVTALKNNIGASNYYSDQNPKALVRLEGHIPDADGYPMTMTEYMPDGTGRIKRQGGVGPTHQLETGRETKYFYATPSAQELYRLFGNAVGDSVHYQKVMAVDPNGQASVSYKNLSGSVIATALGGNSPDSLASLTSSVNAETIMYASFPSNYSVEQNEIWSSKEIVVSGDSSKYDIAYEIEIPRVSFDSFPDMCFDCVYDLVINLKDNCGNELLDGDTILAGNQGIIRTVGKLGVDFDTICEVDTLKYSFYLDSTLLNDTFLSVYLNVGKYTLSKRLVISKSAYEFYYDRFITSSNVKSLDDFTQELLIEADTLSCNIDCDACLTALGAYSSYESSRFSDLLSLGFDSTTIITMANDEFEALKSDCILKCEDTISTCSTYYYTFLFDLIPEGQYAPVIRDEQGIITAYEGYLDTDRDNGLTFNYKEYDSSGTWINITYLDEEGNPIYVEIDGVSKTPNQLTPDEFIRYFETSWAANFIAYHLEYCKFTSCISVATSISYNEEMQKITSLVDAYAQGYLDPLGQNGSIPTLVDPYFDSLPAAKTSFISGYINSYSAVKFDGFTTSCSNVSILDYALLTYYSDWDFTDCADMNAWLAAFDITDTANLCDDRADAVWAMYKSLYYSQKQKYFEDNGVFCTPTVPAPFTKRYTDIADIDDDTGIDDTEDDIDAQRAYGNNGVLSSCDDVCEGQAIYWLEKLGGCNLDTLLRDQLIDTFKVICKNGCDNEHPWGAFDYPQTKAKRFGTDYYSFEEAFNDMVPLPNRALNTCNVWAISAPMSYNRGIYGASAMNDSCFEVNMASDTCYANASEAFKEYSKAKAMSLDENCTECISCQDFEKAYNALSSVYDGTFPNNLVDNQEIVTNYMNSYFGFNLTYWEYADFYNACNDCDSTVDDSAAIAIYIIDHFDEFADMSIFKRRYLYSEYDWCNYDIVTYYDNDADSITAENDYNSWIVGPTADVVLAGITPSNTLSLEWSRDTSVYGLDMPVDSSQCQPNYYARNTFFSFDITTYVDSFSQNYYDTTYWYCNNVFTTANSHCKSNYTQGFYRKKNGVYTFIPYSDREEYHEAELFAGDTLYIYDSLSSSYKPIADEQLLISLGLVHSGGQMYVHDQHLGNYSRYRFGGNRMDVVNHDTDYNIVLNQCKQYIVSFDSGVYIKDILQKLSYTQLSTTKFTISAQVLLFNNQIDTIDLKIEWVSGECADSVMCASYNESTLCNRKYGTITYSVPDPCITWKKMWAQTKAKIVYDDYIDSLSTAFKDEYYEVCMLAQDKFDVNYELKEYHYTLYYYDQAGNLIQTVPPAGVDVISSQTDLAQIAAARSGNATPLYPNHTLTTRYNYNSLNEVRWQSTPDGGESEFWYDRLGRMAVSQNSEQKVQALEEYSYIMYDSLGRTNEVGQIQSAASMTTTISSDTSQLYPWIRNNTKEQITKTWYDLSPFPLNDFEQNNLRGRVVSMAYYENDGSTYNHAVHYDYDIHGNVKRVDREITALFNINEEHKIIEYDYDLVSGNVNYVYYQKGNDDQFSHKYIYDADNRLIEAYTSQDNIYWDRDAKYEYYLHGPLSRVTLGELNVQGLDYAYTLHGWLKGVNSNSLDEERDLGQDGYSLGANALVARDVFGFSLHYFEGDYTPINSWNTTNKSNYFLMEETTSNGFAQQVGDLYNGNISRMVTALTKVSNTVVGRAYKYDQLNRISEAFTYSNYSLSGNKWLTGPASSDYQSSYTYDANGNILTLNRNAGAGTSMDELTYNYIQNTNQLEFVNDNIGYALFSNDIDNQQPNNYRYDNIGNLIGDVSEEIEEIKWTVYGKIKSIIRMGGSGKPNLNFEYSPDGHRVAKHVIDTSGKTTSTWYVRDVSGNIMSTYTRSYESAQNYANLSSSVMDLYDYIDSVQGFNLTLGFLEDELNWSNLVSTTYLNSLKSELAVQSKEDEFLDYFDPTPYLNGPLLDGVYNLINPVDVIEMYRLSGLIDDQIADHLCILCMDEFLLAMMNYDYYQFLDYLEVFHVAMYNDLVVNLGLNPGDPKFINIPNIMALSPPPNTIFLLSNFGHDCFVYKQILQSMVPPNSPMSSILLGTPGIQMCLRNLVSDMDLASIITNFHTPQATWDMIFLVNPNTESTYVSSILTNDKTGFLHYASIVLNSSSLMRDGVSTILNPSMDDWLNAVRNHFGETFYQEVIQHFSSNSNQRIWSYRLNEQHIYGTSRLGIVERNLLLARQPLNVSEVNYISSAGDSSVLYTYQSDYKTFYRGEKRYELSNHLGNVLAVITDRRIQTCLAGDIIYYSAQVVSVSDYYPFGMQIKERQWKNSSFSYRFGFNSKEKDDEVSGSGNSYDYGFRIYNPRLGKFLSVDPLFQSYPWLTPYQFASNLPIAAIDLDGLESKIVINEIQADGTVKLVSTTNYYTEQYVMLLGRLVKWIVGEPGVLGKGTYSVTKNLDGSYTEKWEPEEGNSVNAFESKMDGTRWVSSSETDAMKMFQERLNSRLIEQMVEDMIYEEQKAKLPENATDEQKAELMKQIQADIVVLETDNTNLKGKFAGFKDEETAKKYTADWVKRDPSEAHKSVNAFNGKEFKNSNSLVDYYDGAADLEDDFGPHIGIIKEGWFDHYVGEALPCVISGECNLGLDNAKDVKEYQE
ncbi:MAG: hypothetical protein COA58_13475 [Bacteroidetes bacterium]|nr:MAG: hypothetical protein COA58_13475 [Bacteroidota bacterium]